VNYKQAVFSILLILTVTACNASPGTENKQSEAETIRTQHLNKTEQMAEENPAPSILEKEPEDESHSVSIKATSSEEISSIKAIAFISGVECDNPENGKGCKASAGGDDFYDVAIFPPCKSTYRFSYAGVSKDANLVDKVAPEYDSSIIVAELKAGQVVCVRASASYALQGEKYYFMVAVPAESVSACAGESPCSAYGNRQVVWRAEVEEKKCKSTGVDRFEGVCAMGWMNSEYLDFKNRTSPFTSDSEQKLDMENTNVQ
jgi:hypothetical protein